MKKLLTLVLVLTMSFSVMAQQKFGLKDIPKLDTTGLGGVKNSLSKVNPKGLYSETKNGVSVVYGDGKQAVQYLAEKTDSLINKSGRIIEKAGAIVWDATVNQQKVKSLAYLACLLIYVGLLYFYKSQINKFTLAKKDKYDHYTTHQGYFIWIGLFLVVGLGIFNALHFVPMLTGFFNPEFGAMLDLIKAGNYILK